MLRNVFLLLSVALLFSDPLFAPRGRGGRGSGQSHRGGHGGDGRWHRKTKESSTPPAHASSSDPFGTDGYQHESRRASFPTEGGHSKHFCEPGEEPSEAPAPHPDTAPSDATRAEDSGNDDVSESTSSTPSTAEAPQVYRRSSDAGPPEAATTTADSDPCAPEAPDGVPSEEIPYEPSEPADPRNTHSPFHGQAEDYEAELPTAGDFSPPAEPQEPLAGEAGSHISSRRSSAASGASATVTVTPPSTRENYDEVPEAPAAPCAGEEEDEDDPLDPANAPTPDGAQSSDGEEAKKQDSPRVVAGAPSDPAQRHQQLVASPILTTDFKHLMFQALTNTTKELFVEYKAFLVYIAPVDAHLAQVGDTIFDPSRPNTENENAFIINALTALITEFQIAAMQNKHNSVDSRILALKFIATLRTLILTQTGRNLTLLAAVEDKYLRHCLATPLCPALDPSQEKHLNQRQLQLLRALQNPRPAAFYL